MPFGLNDQNNNNILSHRSSSLPDNDPNFHVETLSTKYTPSKIGDIKPAVIEKYTLELPRPIADAESAL